MGALVGLCRAFILVGVVYVNRKYSVIQYFYAYKCPPAMDNMSVIIAIYQGAILDLIMEGYSLEAGPLRTLIKSHFDIIVEFKKKQVGISIKNNIC